MRTSKNHERFLVAGKEIRNDNVYFDSGEGELFVPGLSAAERGRFRDFANSHFLGAQRSPDAC